MAEGTQGSAYIWCGRAAFLLGLLYALVSAYWGSGGTVGLDTIGGDIERRAREGDAQLFAIVWITAVVKLAVAALGLTVVRQRLSRLLPRRLSSALVRTAAIGLILYGGALTLVEVLVKADLVNTTADIDAKAFDWHLYLWDPWFLLWGLLLATTTHGPTKPLTHPKPTHN
ncbi:DUF3995 domain-containing protein [Yinghuangia sp. ASG 101]|uniref:DUF3995 domain-containing protein n=1 Tax=Yinghuangia sp. ASG 101 TaxID=2896848 RepID=UPI001E4760B9|nr:DUF3995 domain-containing protein [Yinghuangia sp. ASG 101]UGQ11549.1 DUF3995 domain-containing protein [Yinghuangia sp. ASG 101]